MRPWVLGPHPVCESRVTTSTFNVCLMGASLRTNNRGVSALNAALAKLVWEVHPSATIRMLIGYSRPEKWPLTVAGSQRSIEVINYRLSPRARAKEQIAFIMALALLVRLIPVAGLRAAIVNSNPLLRSMSEADFIGEIRGGDSFSDIYGKRRFLAGALPVLVCILLRKEYVLLPQTYGPFRTWTARNLARLLLRRASQVYARDRESAEAVQELVGRAVAVCPDVAFALESSLPNDPKIDPPLARGEGECVVGLNVNGLMYNGGYSRANMFGLKLDYAHFLMVLIRTLLQEPNCRILMVPHTYGGEENVNSDPAAIRKVIAAFKGADRSRIHVVTGEHDQHEIKGVVGMCDFFIGSRMHACIAALSQGIPTVGIAYSRKFRGVFEVIGRAEDVIDGMTIEANDAVGRVMRLFRAREVSRPSLEAEVGAAKVNLRKAVRHMMGLERQASASCAENTVRR